MNRRIVWIICAISLLGNVLLGGMMFYRHQITKTSEEYGSFSFVPTRLAMIQEYADKASNGTQITANLALVNNDLFFVDGILRGLKGQALSRGIDFTPIINALDARLGFPSVHEGEYTPQELNAIKISDARLHALARDLKGTSFSTNGMAQLKQSIDKINAYVIKWGY